MGEDLGGRSVVNVVRLALLSFDWIRGIKFRFHERLDREIDLRSLVKGKGPTKNVDY